jgi:hypothetical protein
VVFAVQKVPPTGASARKNPCAGWSNSVATR